MRQTKSSINPRYPTLQSVQDFWERQLSDAKLYNSEASWLKGEQQKSEQLPQMENVSFTAIDVKDAVGKLMNWKSPGPDRIQNFWYKRLTCVHGKLSQLINDALDDPKKCLVFSLMVSLTCYLKMHSIHTTRQNIGQ